MTTLQQLRDGAEDRFDLTEPAHLDQVRELAEALADHDPSEILGLARQDDAPLGFRIAAKLAASRRAMADIDRPVDVGVTFAMWGERSRLQPRSDGNPNGEDSLRVKLDQLAWITEGTPVTWTLYAVDDGCPDGSGALASEIAATHPLGGQVRVLHLAERVPTTDGPLRNLASADDSRKAGAIILGCQAAIDDGVDAVIYTDADNSVHLGQLGLLLRPHVVDGMRVVLGNRQDPDSVLVKEGARWGVGIKNLRHMQRMVGHAIFSRGITDTQAAFKLYERSVVADIIADPTVFDFSFDTDWLAAVIARDEPFAQVPFAFIDSAAESASAKQQPMTTWETLLLGLLAALRRHDLLRTEASREMAGVLDAEITSHHDLDLIIDVLPPELAEAGQADFGDPEVMSAAAMGEWIRERKRLAATGS